MRALISQGLTEFGLSERISHRAAAELDLYGLRLIEKNQVMNLTAITEPEQVARLHMLDCAALLRCADFEGKTLIDVGTGAGFPGVVLKILVPSLRVTLLDSLNKRLDWLQELCQELQVTNVETVHGRAEEVSREEAFRERFDFATARAVAELRTLAELCLPYVKVGGLFLAMKSTDCGPEVRAAEKAIRLLGGSVEDTVDYTIPHTDVTHRVLVIRKVSPTPAKYPRRFAQIKKQPL